MHHPAYLRRARELCDAHGIFLIADEIAVGFGRTGTMFACEQAGITPDLLCLSKGLTGGALPLAAVLATQAHLRRLPRRLARARLPAFAQLHRQPAGLRRRAGVAGHLRERRRARAQPRHGAADGRRWPRHSAAHPHVADVRQAGMIVAIEMTPRRRARRTPFEPRGSRGLRAYRAALERGVLLRPLGDVLYWMPPYCIGDARSSCWPTRHDRRRHREAAHAPDPLPCRQPLVARRGGRRCPKSPPRT